MLGKKNYTTRSWIVIIDEFSAIFVVVLLRVASVLAFQAVFLGEIQTDRELLTEKDFEKIETSERIVVSVEFVRRHGQFPQNPDSNSATSKCQGQPLQILSSSSELSLVHLQRTVYILYVGRND